MSAQTTASYGQLGFTTGNPYQDTGQNSRYMNVLIVVDAPVNQNVPKLKEIGAWKYQKHL